MRLIGRYEVTGEVESGGTTLKAFDPAMTRAVEIRTVELGQLRNVHGEQAPERLIEALRLASTLAHPNIAAIYDLLKQNDSIHIVSEFVPGHLLEETLVDGNATAATGVVLELRQIAQALDYAHRKGAIHGALTPKCIIVSPSVSGQERLMKITGFGFDALLGQEYASRLSPEQLNGAPADAQSDQYSLAAIVYRLLCGQKPSTENPKPVDELNPALTESAGKVLTRALARDPQQRFASASDFFGALSIAVAESKHLPEPDPAGKMTQSYRLQTRHTLRQARASEVDTEPRASTSGEPMLQESLPKQRFAAGKNLALVVILLFLLAATLMFIVRMNSGGPIPVQVIETQSAPTTPPPVTKQPVAPPHTTTETATRGRAEQQVTPTEESAGHAQPERAPTQIAPNGGGTADVELLTDPPGARIAVDGRSDGACAAPCTMTLSAGRHTLTAQLDGYAIAQRIFSVPDTSSLYIQLAHSFGLLVLSSTPAGASIVVDGNNNGRTPATLRLSVGVHRITLLNGSQRHDETVNVEAETMQSRNVRW